TRRIRDYSPRLGALARGGARDGRLGSHGRASSASARSPVEVVLDVLEQGLELEVKIVRSAPDRRLEEGRRVRHLPRLALPGREVGKARQVEDERGRESRVAAGPGELERHARAQEAFEV